MTDWTLKRQLYHRDRSYKSKLDKGMTYHDGAKMSGDAKHASRCLKCGVRLTRKEYDQLGLCCVDCY